MSHGRFVAGANGVRFELPPRSATFGLSLWGVILSLLTSNLFLCVASRLGLGSLNKSPRLRRAARPSRRRRGALTIAGNLGSLVWRQPPGRVSGKVRQAPRSGRLPCFAACRAMANNSAAGFTASRGPGARPDPTAGSSGRQTMYSSNCSWVTVARKARYNSRRSPPNAVRARRIVPSDTIGTPRGQ